jgi:hypothetical protein
MNKRTGQVSEEDTTKNGEIMEEKKWSEDNKRHTIRWRFTTLLLGGMAILLVCVLLGLFWQMHGSQPVPRSNASFPPPATYPSNSASGSPQADGTPAAWPTRYKDAAKQEIATELNLSLVQMKDRLSQPRVSLFEVMTEQGVQPDQVFPLWLNALQDAGNLMIKVGTWTPQQADSYWHYWNDHQKSALGQKNMDAELSRWFTEG